MKTRAIALLALAGCGLFPSLDGLTGPDASVSGNDAEPEAQADAAEDVATADATDATDATEDEAAPDVADAPACDATSCNGSCVDLQTSGTNCGACGHDCLGATCTAGKCATTVLITGESRPYDLAADTGTLFWTDQGSGQVATCSVSNCPNTRVTLASSKEPDDIAIDATNVYWSDSTAGPDGGPPGGAVYECARAGCNKTATPLATTQAGIDGITTANGVVYWSSSTGVMSCPATGCTTPTVFLAHSTDDLAVVGQTFFAAAYSHVYACALPSCTGLVTIPSSGAEGVASDGTTIFFTSTNGGVYDCPVTGCATASAFAASPYPGDVVTDGKNVYWVDENNGAGYTCPVAGCNGSPVAMATGMSGPKGVALDDKRVYFADTGNGRLLWIAKL